MRDDAMTKNEGLERICPAGGQHLGNNNLTYGDRSNYVRVSFSTNGYSGQYELLKLKHIRDGETIDFWSINISDNEHRPCKSAPACTPVRPDIDKGGYFWYNRGFYCWQPVGIKPLVQEILEFTGVLESATV